MRTDMAIRWAHRLLTGLLLFVVIGFGVYQYFISGPYDDRLYGRQQLTDDIWLYITEYRQAGATDADVYRYYLNKNLDGDPLKTLAQTAPFLTADRADARVRGDGNRVIVSYTGRVYAFTNSAFFYREKDKPPVMPTIDFSARGESAWR